MASIITTPNGQFIFLALEQPVTGQRVVLYQAILFPLIETHFIALADSGAVGATNVAMIPDDPFKIIIHGDLDDTGISVYEYDIVLDTLTDRSPTGAAAGKPVNTLVINPIDGLEMICTVDGDQDLFHTINGGTSWTLLNGAIGLDATAIAAVFRTGLFNEIFVAGHPVNQNLFYSDDGGTSLTDIADAGLAAIANITNIIIVEA